ncbi:hypothetical protein OOT46_16330 [Aquabacterium sp. A7-Y]|uniref:hypothetical protein n=1 Tax=Aquabacterium sp. A7-Y TaxID=1349605 RepID=UPI00223CBC51|nr:hypothetical protein [Aquabacterium sp. A7-Y]MCW7539411.1 hypothetical protein [Aquabacterium sp. A7-Y]
MAVADKLAQGGLVTLPPEAGNIDAPVFEPNDKWLQGADAAQQKAAMWRWFGTRYADPKLTTPHDKSGAYLYTNGGPYRAGEVLHKRFGTLVPGAVIDQLLEVLRSEVGDEWAPKPMDKESS